MRIEMPVEHPEDCRRIQWALASEGYQVSLRDCEKLWQDHSSDYAAGWLLLPKDARQLWDELEPVVRRYGGVKIK